MESNELPNSFKLTGSGLESELPAFIEHLTAIDPIMAQVFSKHLPHLKDAATDDLRRAARATFNAAVRADLFEKLAESEERQS